MEPENPLLAPRLFWQVALAITAVLVMVRVALYLRARSQAGGPEAAEPDDVGAAAENREGE